MLRRRGNGRPRVGVVSSPDKAQRKERPCTRNEGLRSPRSSAFWPWPERPVAATVTTTTAHRPPRGRAAPRPPGLRHGHRHPRPHRRGHVGHPRRRHRRCPQGPRRRHRPLGQRHLRGLHLHHHLPDHLGLRRDPQRPHRQARLHHGLDQPRGQRLHPDRRRHQGDPGRLRGRPRQLDALRQRERHPRHPPALP